MNIKNFLSKTPPFNYFIKGYKILNDPHYKKVDIKDHQEMLKSPARTEIINFLLSLQKNDTNYLEIGVRNPDDNFNKIKAKEKYSVDPGVEFKSNPVDFNMTSDLFFNKLSQGEILSKNIKFDVIFLDGLHLAEQVDRDVNNAMNYIKDSGFIVLHDCNPPSEWHARENYNFWQTPAHGNWNGTTWKAFLKWRKNTAVFSCCIDTDWGVGILSKTQPIGNPLKMSNPFYEYSLLDKNRKEFLNLIDFNTLKAKF